MHLENTDVSDTCARLHGMLNALDIVSWAISLIEQLVEVELEIMARRQLFTFFRLVEHPG